MKNSYNPYQLPSHHRTCGASSDWTRTSWLSRYSLRQWEKHKMMMERWRHITITFGRIGKSSLPPSMVWKKCSSVCQTPKVSNFSQPLLNRHRVATMAMVLESILAPFRLHYMPSARPLKWMACPTLPTTAKANFGSKYEYVIEDYQCQDPHQHSTRLLSWYAWSSIYYMSLEPNQLPTNFKLFVTCHTVLFMISYRPARTQATEWMMGNVCMQHHFLWQTAQHHLAYSIAGNCLHCYKGLHNATRKMVHKAVKSARTHLAPRPVHCMPYQARSTKSVIHPSAVRQI